MVCSKADDGQFIVLHGPNSPTAQIVLMGAPRSKRVSFKFLVNAANISRLFFRVAKHVVGASSLSAVEITALILLSFFVERYNYSFILLSHSVYSEEADYNILYWCCRYMAMSSCWLADPCERPSTADLQTCLHNFCSSIARLQ